VDLACGGRRTILRKHGGTSIKEHEQPAKADQFDPIRFGIHSDSSLGLVDRKFLFQASTIGGIRLVCQVPYKQLSRAQLCQLLLVVSCLLLKIWFLLSAQSRVTDRFSRYNSEL
jgi:hypothetical protein